MELTRKLSAWKGLKILSESSRGSLYTHGGVRGESAARPLRLLSFQKGDPEYGASLCSMVAFQPIDGGCCPVVVNHLFKKAYRAAFMALLACQSFLFSIFDRLRLFEM